MSGLPRRFKTVKELEDTWLAYKDYCDNQIVLTHDFSAKNSEFVSKELKRSITYTIEGFCVFAKLARSRFYTTYDNKKPYADMVTRMKEECEIDARKKFELQLIPSSLAGLWMSRHGYTTKTEEKTEAKTTVGGNISVQTKIDLSKLSYDALVQLDELTDKVTSD